MNFERNRKIVDEIRRFSSYPEVEGKIHIPSLQRSLDERRIPEMLSHIDETGEINAAPIFGSIILCNLHNKLYVIDGQHRLKALERHYQATKKLVPFNAVIYTINDPHLMQYIFTKVNSGVPVPDYILNPSPNDNRQSLLRLIEAEVVQYSLFKSATTRQYRPYINVNTFMNRLCTSCIIEYIENIGHFRQIFNQANEYLKNKCLDVMYISSHKITQPMLKKCKDSGVYIGLDQNMLWLDELYQLPNNQRFTLPSS